MAYSEVNCCTYSFHVSCFYTNATWPFNFVK
uniref:Uncharacterized protein n=1 Tax=Arundo donax TaxID=35708 RepID=A0A0A8ZB15_ARUDO